MDIRIAKKTDLERIVEIYNQAIATKKATANLKELSIEDRMGWFNEHTSDTYPIYVAILDDKVVGWCSLSPYRPGRAALRQTAEISYYVDFGYHGIGVGSALINHAIMDCKRLGIRTVFALILEWNKRSRNLLEKFCFEQWGLMPAVANFYGRECGHCIYGKRIW